MLQELLQQLLLCQDTVSCQLLLLCLQQFEHELHVRETHGLKIRGQSSSEGGQVWVLQEVGRVDLVLQRVLIF